MLTEKQILTFHQMEQSQLDYYSLVCCRTGDLESLRYLLNSSNLKEHVNIHYYDDLFLRTTCDNGYLHIVKFLLTSPELKEHADIHAIEDAAFKSVIKNEYIDLLKYLIFDYKIEETSHINTYLMNENRNDIIKMFERRELEENLQHSLIKNSLLERKLKI